MSYIDLDISAELQAQVQAAVHKRQALQIVGGQTKAFYGRPTQGEVLAVNRHCGILEYEPSELVITARAGTPLAAIEATLAQHQQMLSFEPPHFAPSATLGGAIACGVSGARRPFTGSARDSLLGVKMLNGQGESVKFGGVVIKNVAGFDVARLQVGALGTLGVMLEISLKVMPLPSAEHCLSFELPLAKALELMQQWGRQPWPISAACYTAGQLYLRLSGGESALAATHRQLGGELLTLAQVEQFWQGLRTQQLAFFQDPAPLWQIFVPSATAILNIPGTWLIDWGGALRWLKSTESADAIFAQAQAAGGHACRFRSADGGLLPPLAPALAELNSRIKTACDPWGIFNPGRLYPEW